jgi:hypothetical protein
VLDFLTRCRLCVLRLAAIRRLAYEASDCGLLSPDLAAGIRRVKGVRSLGVRVGNWLTAEEGKKLLAAESADTLRSRRNRALLSLLIGCGLRRGEVTILRFEDFQLREGHWVIGDLRGKGRHIRTIPVPAWVNQSGDSWSFGAGINAGPLLRSINKAVRIWGDGFTPKVIWAIVEKLWFGNDRTARLASLCRLENYAESPFEPLVVRRFPLRRLGIVWTCLQTLQELQDGVFRTVTSRFRSIPSLHLPQNFFFECQVRI